MPSTRPDFWKAKFEANVRRDREVRGMLRAAGWRVATVWECALRKPIDVEETSRALGGWLRDGGEDLEIGAAARS
jgi:DNA mismatch endonuclease (patch repair protein)